MSKYVLPLCFLFLCLIKTAQAQVGVSAQAQGLEFAKNLLPINPTQLVNPNAVNLSGVTLSGVNSSAWSLANNAVALPPILGAFSKPVSGKTFAGNTANGALSSLGQQAQIQCKNYKPNGDAVSDQYCAAVNFLSGSCIEPNALQKNVMQAANSLITDPASVRNNCQGTYGQGVSSYGYSQELSPYTREPNGSGNLHNFSQSTDPQIAVNATPTTSVPCTDIASADDSTNLVKKYTTSTCWITSNSSKQSCSQTLGAIVSEKWTPASQTITCINGQLNGDSCDVVVTSSAQITQSCPVGFNLIDNRCEQSVASNAGINLSCAVGWQWNVLAENCEQSTPLIIAATPKDTPCSNGAISELGNCIQTVILEPITSPLQCGANQSLLDDQCISVQTLESAASQLLSCPSNEVLNGTQCIQTVINSATPFYTCPVGSQINNKSCNSTVSIAPVRQLSCNGIGALSSYIAPAMPYQCYKVKTNFNCSFIAPFYNLTYVNTDISSGQQVCILGPVVILVCPFGSITNPTNSSDCLKNLESDATVGGYSCLSGILSNASCLLITSTIAEKTYYCPTQSNNGVSTSTSALSSSMGNYTCTATTTLTTPATITNSCLTGYTLVKLHCEMIVISPVLVTYSCITPLVLQGKTCLGNSTVSTQALATYYCAGTSILTGTNCISTTLSPPLVVSVCPLGATLSNISGPGTGNCISVIHTPVVITQYCANASAPQIQGCLQYSVSTSWSDACLSLEKSAGTLIVL